MRTERDFELGGEADRLADLNYTACGRIVLETLEMENENGWKRLDENLLLALFKPDGSSCMDCDRETRMRAS
jgi:hypothetical protein